MAQTKPMILTLKHKTLKNLSSQTFNSISELQIIEKEIFRKLYWGKNLVTFVMTVKRRVSRHYFYLVKC